LSSVSNFLSRLLQLTLLLTAAALIAFAASDQKPVQQTKPYALLFGTVWGADQRPIAGVTIKIRRAEEKKARWTLLSDSRGEFAQRVPPGKEDYVVRAEFNGKNRPKPVETTVHIENDERADFGLHLSQ